VNDPVLTANVMDVAADAVVANELEIALLAQLAVPNVEPLCVPINDPVNEPVLICAELDTVPVGNPLGITYDAVVANEEEIALLAQLPVPVNEPVNEPVNDPVLICAELLTVPGGNPLGSAYDAVVATLLVPNTDAVILPCTFNDPVSNILPETSNMVLGVVFPMPIPVLFILIFSAVPLVPIKN
jgi:hypothetical protein